MMYSMRFRDPLTIEETASYLARLSGGEPRRDLLCLAETDSTNRLLLQMAADGAPDGQVVIADCQTAGRGRLGRSFASPAGYGLYFSYLFRTGGNRSRLSSGEAAQGTPADEVSPLLLTAHTAVAVSDAIEAVCGIRPGIKWVNDLLLPERADGRMRKVCGILAQAVTAEDSRLSGIVVGIGINVHEDVTDFPAELQEIAGSLFTATGRHAARAQLAAALVRSMDALRGLSREEAATLLTRYRAHSLMPGKAITVIRGEISQAATALAIEDDFALRVRFADGTEESLRSGDVSVRF